MVPMQGRGRSEPARGKEKFEKKWREVWRGGRQRGRPCDNMNWEVRADREELG